MADLAVGRTGSTLFSLGAAGLGVFPDTDIGDDFLEFWSLLVGTPVTRATYPGPEGDMFLDDLLLNALPLKPGSFMFSVFIHEIGHALGLKHSFDDGGNGRPTFADLGIGAFDTGFWTVMSSDELSESATFGWQATPMPLDILAIQHIYGANMSYRTGNDVYILSDDGIVKTIWDAGGIDTISAAGLRFGVVIDLTPGSFITHGPKGSTTAIAFGVSIENAIGTSFADTLIGTADDNLLDGRGGADTMIGGDGDDMYVADNPGDVVIEDPGEGSDTLVTPFATTLSAALETLILTGKSAVSGTGNAADNLLIGNAGANVLTGLDGDDLLIGGGGADHLVGGDGDDVYEVNSLADIVEETGNGHDRVQSSVSYSLAALVLIEDLTLIGRANTGIGNALDNVILGNVRPNTLDGGTGADSLTGGLGNDTYVVDNVGDLVIELPGEGIEHVRSSISYTLGDDLERLTLLGTADLDATGNDLNNILTGNDGNNRLDGGSGLDTLIGGRGGDTYVVSQLGDKVAEATNAGSDTVESAISYTLGANLETLILTSTADIDGTGNALANVLIGNAGDNRLDGRGGADTMIGGDGDDLYLVDNPGDMVIENPGEGSDTLVTRLATILADGVENLTLTGKSAMSGTGNAADNWLFGNAGANVLSGLDGDDLLVGGGGADHLIGGDGDDMFVGGNGIDLLSGGSGSDLFILQTWKEVRDTILDFASGVAGDVLSISDLLDGYVENQSDPLDFVLLLENATDTLLRVDPNGPVGGSAFRDAFLLSDITGLSVDNLLDDGNLALV